MVINSTLFVHNFYILYHFIFLHYCIFFTRGNYKKTHTLIKIQKLECDFPHVGGDITMKTVISLCLPKWGTVMLYTISGGM